MKKINKLTLLITFYNPTAKEKEYWFNFYSKYINQINIVFLVDGTNVQFDKRIESKDIFVEKENKGKFRLVYDFVKKGNIKTPYFKIVDPDDYILFKNIKNSDFDNGDEILFIPIFRGKEIKSRYNFNIWLKSLKLVKKYWKSNFGNSYTIYPTKFIENDNLFSELWDVPIHDDQVLGFICLGNGAEISTVSKPFYYYNEFNGVTNSENIELMLDKAIITFKLLAKLNKKSNIQKYSNWPFDYKWYTGKIEDFLSENNRKNEKILYKKLDLLKEIDIYEHLK